MKIKVELSIGLLGHREDILEVPDEELENMTEKEIDDYINEEYVQVWANNYIDMGYEIID
jgi:hypothetical protein